MPPKIKAEGDAGAGPPVKKPRAALAKKAAAVKVNVAVDTDAFSSSSSSQPSDAEIERAFIEFCGAHPQGARQDAFTAANPHLPLSSLMVSINKLLKAGKLSVLTDKDGIPHFQLRSTDEVKKLIGLSREELIIYQLIGAETNRGLWIRDIRRRSNLPQIEVNKILKSLESRKLIKAEKSIEGKNKKVYMLYELEPSKEIRGNSWYTGAEFDTAFIEALRETSMAYVKDACEKKGKPGVAVDEVHQFLRMTGAFAVECTVDEIELILVALCHDQMLRVANKATATGNSGSGKLFAPVLNGPFVSDLTAIPCTVCPVSSQCSDEPDAYISPYTCQYYQEWLDF